MKGRLQSLLGRVVDATPQRAIAAGLDVVRRLPIRQGEVVYEREWDVLVILDACRWDMYQRVIGESDAVMSVASTSTEWMRKTFADRYDEEVARTAYVSANPYSHQLDADRFGLLDHVWKDHWDEDLGTIPPDPVTDHGIAVSRTGEYDHVICHYMQPHFPFIADGAGFGRLGKTGFGLADDDDSVNVWEMVERGELEVADVIEAYDDNLEYVFESVQDLLENVDGTVAITADHGNALGEWGMWGHRAYVPSMALRKVPWDVRDCSDSRTYEPDWSPTDADRETGDEVHDRLRALGYTDE